MENQELPKKPQQLLWLKFCAADAKAKGSLFHYPDSLVPPGSALSFRTSLLGTFLPCKEMGGQEGEQLLALIEI